MTSMKNRTLDITKLFANLDIDLHEEWLHLKREDVAIVLTSMLGSAGMSRADLARKLDWKPSRVTRALSGKENLTINTLSEIVDAAGYDFDILLRKRCESRAFQPWEQQSEYQEKLEFATMLLEQIRDMHHTAKGHLKEAAAMKATAEDISRTFFRGSAYAKRYDRFSASSTVSANDGSVRQLAVCEG